MNPESSDPPRRRRSGRLRRLAFWLPWAACSALAVTPSMSTGPVAWSDKGAHVLAFAYLMFSLTLAHYPHAAFPLRPAVWLAGYGLGLEAVQALLPTRRAETGDLVADLLGIAAGWAAWAVARRLWPRAIPGG